MSLPSPADAERQVVTRTAVNLGVAAVLLGVSQATASRTVADGTFPVPVVRMGTRVIVPTAPLRDLLHLRASHPAA
ncbi:hypothetical protein [Tsukamurella pseudospumae]|uniref:Helix-turn-helix domain-containing protein n=1 Tax=Tsukamurella pseudospumae TaxID=239498 RepID=A0A138AEI8_9ACTN|nr:hypothetical protein [Tsukamurella pseudospumae]KXP08787.1 hypothetical protein AXK60_08975 [Tsukamurella pseudospumae]